MWLANHQIFKYFITVNKMLISIKIPDIWWVLLHFNCFSAVSVLFWSFGGALSFFWYGTKSKVIQNLECKCKKKNKILWNQKCNLYYVPSLKFHLFLSKHKYLLHPIWEKKNAQKKFEYTMNHFSSLILWLTLNLNCDDTPQTLWQ